MAREKIRNLTEGEEITLKYAITIYRDRPTWQAFIPQEIFLKILYSMAISLPTPWELGELRQLVESSTLREEHSPGPVCAIIGLVAIGIGTVVLGAVIGGLGYLIGAIAATIWAALVEKWSKEWPKQPDKTNLPSPVPTDKVLPGTYPPKPDPYNPEALIKIYPWLASYPAGDPTFGRIYPTIQFAAPYAPTNIPFIDRVYFPEIPEYKSEFVTYQSLLCSDAGITTASLVVSPSIERWMVINTVKQAIIQGSIHNAILWCSNFLRGIWYTISAAITSAADWMVNVWLGIKDTFSEIWTAIKVSLANIYDFLFVDFWDMLVKIWGSVANVAQSISDLVQNFGQIIWSALRTLALEFWDGAKAAFKKIYEFFTITLPSVLSSINEALLTGYDKFVSAIKDLADRIEKDLKFTGETFVDKYIPVITAGLKGVWSSLKWFFEQFGNSMVSVITDLTVGQGEVTPERAPGIAGRLVGVAIGLGVSAHLTSTATEVFHPTHTIGLHYISAFLSDMGAFGRIAAASVGVMVALAVRQPMTYYVNARVRPMIPRENMLQVMAVKGDISLATFRQAMAYQGYGEKWIDAYQRTMFREPRYFELSMMGEDEVATEEWLFGKAKRAGYDEEDQKVFVRSLLKKIARTERLDLYRQAFYLCREGYIDEGRFEEILEGMEKRPEAISYAKYAARLAYILEYTDEMVKLYTDQYLKDVITDYDLELAISTLVVDPVRANLKLRQARIRKQPKPAKKEKKEVEAAIRELQEKYTTLYILQYRKDEVDEKRLLANLVGIGIEPDLALVTMLIEKTRKGE